MPFQHLVQQLPCLQPGLNTVSPAALCMACQISARTDLLLSDLPYNAAPLQHREEPLCKTSEWAQHGESDQKGNRTVGVGSH